MVRGFVSWAIDPFAAPDPDGGTERDQEEHGKQYERLVEVRREQTPAVVPRVRALITFDHRHLLRDLKYLQ
jgi:hypothetical protein